MEARYIKKRKRKRKDCYNEKVVYQVIKCDGGIKYLRQVGDQIGKEKGTFQDQEARINCSFLWTQFDNFLCQNQILS